jgi:hypothetical protein
LDGSASPKPTNPRERADLWPGATWGHAVALEIVKAAANGNAQAAREIRESTEGKAPQRPADADSGEITVSIIHVGETSGQRVSGELPRPYVDIGKK